MDGLSIKPGTIDPEVRAYVYSLVTALGGTGAEEDGRYVLGDDALACLKDIKRWLKLYDEKLHRLDVARCLAEANLVKGDLLEILGSWPEGEGEDKIRAKISLACLELLVPLTWPLEKEELQITANHYQHMPYLQLAQIGYKREILEHWSSTILRTSIRIGLPSIALPIAERSQRDEGIIKLLLYFLRNIVMIAAPADLLVEWNENEVSRSATIIAFHTQDVFPLILTVASNIGEDFNTQDVVLLEVLFHLLKGISVERLFMDDEQIDKKNTTDLKNLMDKEASMLRSYAKNAPSRHSRFGSMIWVHREDGKVSTLTGQDALRDCATAFAKMDQSKKWKKPRRGPKEQRTSNHFDVATSISKSAKPLLRSFVEDFLDSGFNPLFSHLRKAIEREAERALEMHTQQFLYLTGWFLEAERCRIASTKKARANARSPKSAEAEVESYGLVAAVLNQETFILLNRYMQERLDTKAWHELDAGMRCFTQILLTVQEMSLSNNDEDQEIADNIQNRLFYEETTHDRVLAILRGYKDQGFSYLDACTELAHVFLRLLERYSKENVDLQIRSRRKARKRKKATAQTQEEGQDVDQNSEDEDELEAQRTSRERKFDFQRFAARFVTQPCVDTFVSLTTYYKDLSTEQLKRAHRFFYRVGFKQEMCTMLFRLDIISLFNRMIKGPEPLSGAMCADWQELIKQIFKRLVKKMKDRSELAVELLFSKIPSTAFYLEYGYDRQAISGPPRAPAELEVKEDMSRDGQIGVVVAAMLKADLEAIMFVGRALESAVSERQSWEAEAAARTSQTNTPEESETQGQEVELSAVPSKGSPPSIVLKPTSEPIRLALFKNARLRLLFTLIGLERLGESDDPDASWLFPPRLSSEELKHSAKTIEQHRLNPSTGYGDDGSIAPEDMLRRKRAPLDRAVRPDSIGIGKFDDFIDSDSEIEALETELEAVKESAEFPSGGPTSRKSSALEQLKKRKKKLRKRRDDVEGEEGTLFLDGDEDELDAEAERRRAKRKARLLNDLERRRKIKSTEFVHSSDEEDDVERDKVFFEAEEKRRVGQKNKVREILLHEYLGGEKNKGKGKKRKSEGGVDQRGNEKKRRVDSGDEGEGSLVEDEEGFGMAALSSSPPQRKEDMGTSEVEDEDDTPLSSQTEENIGAEPRSKESVDELSASKIQSGPFADDEDEDGEGETEPDEPNQDGRQPLFEIENPKVAPPVAQMEVDKGGEDSQDDFTLSNNLREQRRRITILDDSDED